MVNIQANNGKTAMHYALQKDRSDIVDYLINHAEIHLNMNVGDLRNIIQNLIENGATIIDKDSVQDRLE